MLGTVERYIDEDHARRLREYAAQKEIDEQAALDVGMKEKAEEFVASGGEIYRVTIN